MFPARTNIIALLLQEKGKAPCLVQEGLEGVRSKTGEVSAVLGEVCITQFERAIQNPFINEGTVQQSKHLCKLSLRYMQQGCTSPDAVKLCIIVHLLEGKTTYLKPGQGLCCFHHGGAQVKGFHHKAKRKEGKAVPSTATSCIQDTGTWIKVRQKHLVLHSHIDNLGGGEKQIGMMLVIVRHWATLPGLGSILADVG